MRRNTVFWGSILVLIGVLLLLDNVLAVDVGDLIWPLVLIALGLWILWGVIAGPGSIEAEETTIPLEGAGQARVRIHHGAGRLRVDASAGSGELATGTFGGGLDYRVSREGDGLDVLMRMPHRAFPSFGVPWMWGPRHTLDWSFGLNGRIPLSLNFEIGANDARLDLTDLRVTDLRLQSGASSTDLKLPANAGHTRASIKTGAASVTVHVPSGVAARIRASGGLASIQVDRNRFPKTGGVYQSPDYDTAPNNVDIDIDVGVGSVSVR
jgi:hypothetical protein